MIAYSGGVDSHVLLHSMAQLCQLHAHFQCRAIHVNHQLHPQSDAWAQHCRQVAQQLTVEYSQCVVHCHPPEGQSLEAYARKKRYAAIMDTLEEGEILLCAHHQDDQAETLLLQLCRGSGVKGCAAMGNIKTLSSGHQLGRPFLSRTRAEIQAYADAHQLNWIEDSANHNLAFSRNFIRHQVLPLLQTHFKGVYKTLHRSAELFGQSQQYIQESLHNTLAAYLCSKQQGLLLDKLANQTTFAQNELLRAFILYHGLLLPSQKKLEDIRQQLFHAKQDAQIAIAFEGAQISRFKEVAYVIKAHQPLHNQELVWSDFKPLALGNGTRLNVKWISGQGLKKPDPQTKVMIRTRQGGEVCRPKGARHRKALKKWFQEYQIPPWQRERLPLIYYNDELVAVGDLFICEPWAVSDGEEGILPTIESQLA